MSNSSRQKAYLGILEDVRQFIDQHNLKQGDRLPSERELSEKLCVGRSSVREALRAMELLGLIETRHGEGTYLTVYQPYHTVMLLSSFILREKSTRNHLITAKRTLEKECAKLACGQLDQADIRHLQSISQQDDLTHADRHAIFFQFIAERASNPLLMKIWQLMQSFSAPLETSHLDIDFFEKLIELYQDNACKAIEQLFLDSVYPVQNEQA